MSRAVKAIDKRSGALSDFMNKYFVYFVMHAKTDHMRVGSTHDIFDRLGKHANAGFSRPVAIIPGTYDNEQATHRLLSDFLDKDYGTSESTYRLEEPLAEYISDLLELGYATPDKNEVATWPSLPFRLWQFGSVHKRTNGDGQIMLWNVGSSRDRIEFASANAVLASRGDEWYTPEEILVKARAVLGAIDLDPASCPQANRTVQARTFYTKKMNGLGRHLDWHGRVWLNPPYGRGPEAAGGFVARLVDEFRLGNVRQAITCLNLNSMSSEWFKPLWETAARHAVVYGRPDFVPPIGQDDSGSPTKGTVISYLGPHATEFSREFRDIAAILTLVEPEVAA